MAQTGDQSADSQATAYAGDFDVVSAASLHGSAHAMSERVQAPGLGDPRRLHRPGRQARLLLDNAREAVAEALGLQPSEVTFVASGTHAVHSGLLGLVKGRHARHVVRSAVEHPAVHNCLDWACDTWRDQLTVHIAPVDRLGRVDLPELTALIGDASDRSPVVVALQSASPEVGTRQPVDAIRAAAPHVGLFCDLSASMGHDVLPNGWDVAAASAHKWGGAPGVGLLLVRRGSRWRNPFPLDDRVDPRSTGFENVPAVLASAAALQARLRDREERDVARRRLIHELRERLTQRIDDVELVGDPEDRLPHVLTFSCLYVDAEALVIELDRAGFAVSSGSACSTDTSAPSPVLAAMGVLTHGNVRVSLGETADHASIQAFVESTAEAVARLRAQVGL